MLQDLRYGIRTLLKHRAFTVMAVLSLALGIGANAAIFSLLDAVLLKTLPVRKPQELVFLETGQPRFKRSSNISYSTFERLRAQNQVLAGASFFSYATRISASIKGQAEIVEGQPVSGDFFSLLGVDAVAGRTLAEADDNVDGAQFVAVISYGYWQRRFASSPSAVGQTVVLNNMPFTIIGVTPPEFFGVIVGSAPDFFVPTIAFEKIASRRFSFRDSSLPFVLARLKPGVTEQQAVANLTLLLQQSGLAEAGTQPSAKDQQSIRRQAIRLLPAKQGFNVLRQQFSQALQLLMAVVGLVLLIACANVANLLLARASSRRKEIALRLALGASRLRLIRQLLIESLLLGLLGGACGLLLSAWSSNLIFAVLTTGRNPVGVGTPFSLNTPVDVRIILFTLVVSLLAAVIFGLVPAWRSTRPDLAPVLKDNTRVSGERFSWGNALVVAQVALSLVLLVGAGLFIRSLSKLKSADIGFKRDSVLLFTVDPQLNRYQRQQIVDLYKQMLGRIAAVPGVHSVSLGRQGLLSGGGTQGSIAVPGHTLPPDENNSVQVGNDVEWNAPYFSQVGPNFFETLGMSMIRGRDFGPQDNETAPKVAVVNEAFARYYFGNEDPIGQHFDRGEQDGALTEIVGLVKDAKTASIREQTPRSFYVPFLQDPSSWRETTFQVRTTGDPLSVVPAIRREVQALDPNVSIFRIRTLEAQVEESLGSERLVTTLASLFGALALILASAGLYGVLSYSVNQRTQEIGIRMALGADRARVMKMILKQGIKLTLVGMLVGFAGAFVLVKSVESLSAMLYGVRPRDPLTFAITAVVLILMTVLACLLPARRAMKVEPVVALRYE